MASPYVAHKVMQRLETMKIENLKRDYSLLSRSDAFRVGINMLEEHPLFGIGLGSFSTKWPGYCGYDTFMIHYEKDMRIYTDCTYNQLLSETGVIGFLLALMIYTGVLAITFKKRREAVEQSNRALINFTSIVLVLIISMLIANIVEDTLLTVRTWLTFAFALCLQKPWFLREDREKES